MKGFRLANKNINAINDQRTRAVMPAKTRTQVFPLSVFGLSLVKALLIAIAIFVGMNAIGQTGNDDQYKKTITERAAKIVNTLEITDSGKYNKVLGDLVNQYSSLNNIQQQNKGAVDGIKQKALAADETTAALKQQEGKKSSQLLQLHKEFIAHLKESLTEEQIEKVKDGMTYRVFPITYAAFLDMIPSLTDEQKAKIYDWLKEARELAMDEGTSDDKHKVFGKYKGRINNYLSASGYDLKKETADWQARIQAAKDQKKKEQAN
jgi:hypothetical protein